MRGWEMDKVVKTDAEWRAQLNDEQYHVARQKGTERPFGPGYNSCHDAGVYTCIGCGLELFSSESKFESGTGWPSFHTPLAAENIIEEADNSLFMRRTFEYFKSISLRLQNFFCSLHKSISHKLLSNQKRLRLSL